MAKKKAGQKTDAGVASEKRQQQEKEEQAVSLSREPSMEDPVEKIQNLKSLNAMLLKETVEKRQQIESLVQAKEALEGELRRNGEKRRALQEEVSRRGDENIVLELEKRLFATMLEVYVREMVDGHDRVVREKTELIEGLKSEVNGLMSEVKIERGRLSRASVERDSVKSEFDLQVKEANGLRERVIELEKKHGVLKVRIGELEAENKGLVKEKTKINDAVVVVTRERDDLERKLEEKMKEIERLKEEVEVIVRVGQETERVKSELEARISSMNIDLEKSAKFVSEYEMDRLMLREKNSELERSCELAVEKEKEMKMVLEILKGEKIEEEKELERLMEEKSVISKQLEMARSKSMEKASMIDALRQEKIEVEEHLSRRVTELAKLNEEAQEFQKYQEEKNKGLSNEISNLSDVVGRLKAEKYDAEKGLDEERKINLNLRSKVLEMERRIDAADKELKNVKIEREGLVQEKTKMEDQRQSLIKEKGMMEKDLSEAKQAIHDMKAKLESAVMRSDRVLAMLRSTAALLSEREATFKGFNDIKLEKDMEPYAAELELIIKALKNKDAMVENMKKHVEAMESSVTQAHKKKNVWTLISSATTVIAAVSVAYLARIN